MIKHKMMNMVLLQIGGIEGDVPTQIVELYVQNWVITVPLTFLVFYLVRWYVMKTMPTFVMYHRQGGLVEQHKAQETVTQVIWKVDEKPFYPKPLKGGRDLKALKSCPPEYWVVRGIPRRLFHVIEDCGGRTVNFQPSVEKKMMLLGKKERLVTIKGAKLSVGALDEEVLTMEYDKAFANKLVEELKRPRSSRFFDILLGGALGFVLGLVVVSQKWIVVT